MFNYNSFNPNQSAKNYHNKKRQHLLLKVRGKNNLVNV